MSTTVIPAAPSVRAAPPSGRDSGGAQGAAPFARALNGALNGALARSRGQADEAEAGHSAGHSAGHRAGHSGDRGPDRRTADAVVDAVAAAELAAELAATADAAGMNPAGMHAALWAIVLGGASAGEQVVDTPAGDPAAGVPTDGLPAGVVPADALPADALPADALPADGPEDGGVAADGTPVPVVVPAAGARSADNGSSDVPGSDGNRAAVPGLGAAAHAAKKDEQHPGTAVSALARARGAEASASGRGGKDASGPVPAATPATPAAAPAAGVAAADAAVLAGLTVVEAPVDGSDAAPGGTPVPVTEGAGALSAGAGGTGRDPNSSGSPATDGVAEVTSVGQPTAPASAVAPADADSATGTTAAQPVGTQVARQVAVLRGGPDGAHTMTLVLTPETLGPVEVEVTLNKGTVDLHLRGAHEQGRSALLDALPDLRRDLEAAGLTCSRVEVDREAGGSWLERHAAQQQAAGERGGRSDRGEPQSRPGQSTADSRDDRTVPTSPRSTSSGVDVLA